MKDNKFIAMTKCYYCMQDSAILLQRNMKDISEYNGKVVDMTPCPDCQKAMESGIILIGIDSTKSPEGWEKESIPNPYRTGLWVVITEDGFKRLVKDNDGALRFGLDNRFMFIDDDAARAVGLYEVAEDEN